MERRDKTWVALLGMLGLVGLLSSQSLAKEAAQSRDARLRDMILDGLSPQQLQDFTATCSNGPNQYYHTTIEARIGAEGVTLLCHQHMNGHDIDEFHSAPSEDAYFKMTWNSEQLKTSSFVYLSESGILIDMVAAEAAGMLAPRSRNNVKRPSPLQSPEAISKTLEGVSVAEDAIVQAAQDALKAVEFRRRQKELQNKLDAVKKELNAH